MRRLPRAHDARLALDEGTAERLLAGRLASADLPPAYARVADLLAAAAAPPDAEELAGEAAAVARFAAAARSRPVRLLHLNPRRSHVLAKLLTVKAAAVALGVLAAGGVAAAATGTLPAPAQQVAHAVLGKAGVPASSAPGASTTTASSASTATTVTTTAAQAHAVGPDAAGPAARGLCRAWAAGQGGQHGKKLDAVAFAALAQAAGGSGKVAAYCAKVAASGAAPSGTAPSSSAVPSTTGGSGRGGSPTSVPPSMVPSSTAPPTTHGGPPSSVPPSTGGH